MFSNIHTYIIGHYNPSVRITGQLQIPPSFCSIILYMSGVTYSLTLTPNDRFLRKFFMAGLFTLRVFARNLLRGNRQRNIFHISFLMTELGYEPRLLRLDHGALVTSLYNSYPLWGGVSFCRQAILWIIICYSSRYVLNI